MVKRFLMGISIIENDSAHFVGQAFTNYPYYINNLLFARYFNIPEQCNIVLFEQYNKYGFFSVHNYNFMCFIFHLPLDLGCS